MLRRLTRKTIAAMCLLVLCATVPGCVMYDCGYFCHDDVSVVVPVWHVHDAWCGHYYHGSAWYYHAGHRHGYGCGHVFVGGRWGRD